MCLIALTVVLLARNSYQTTDVLWMPAVWGVGWGVPMLVVGLEAIFFDGSVSESMKQYHVSCWYKNTAQVDASGAVRCLLPLQVGAGIGLTIAYMLALLGSLVYISSRDRHRHQLERSIPLLIDCAASTGSLSEVLIPNGLPDTPSKQSMDVSASLSAALGACDTGGWVPVILRAGCM